MAAETISFPDTFDEYVGIYGIRDKHEIYTNGSILIPVFRVEQWMEHRESFKRERTCRPVTEYNEETPWAKLVCSECGRSLHWDDTVDEYGLDSVELQPYCGCGARVERDA